MIGLVPKLLLLGRGEDGCGVAGLLGGEGAPAVVSSQLLLQSLSDGAQLLELGHVGADRGRCSMKHSRSKEYSLVKRPSVGILGAKHCATADSVTVF